MHDRTIEASDVSTVRLARLKVGMARRGRERVP